MRGERAQALVFFALVLPLVLLPVAAFSAEAGLLAARQAHLTEVVAQAALDAAQQLDATALRAGSGWRVDPAAARATAQSELATADPAAVLDVVASAGAQVTVAAHETVPLKLAAFVGRPVVTLRARISARLTPGYASPSSLLPLPSRSFSIT